MTARQVRFLMLTCGMLTLHSMCLNLRTLCADEPLPARKAVSSAVDSSEVEEPRGKLTPEQIEKRQKAYIGLLALTGIVIVGLALLALILLWGGRLRRQLRKSDPEIETLDRSFWFLKPPKPSITRSSLPELNRPLDAPPPDSSADSESS